MIIKQSCFIVLRTLVPGRRGLGWDLPGNCIVLIVCQGQLFCPRLDWHPLVRVPGSILQI